MHIAQAVAGGSETTFDLVPNDIIPQQPTLLVDQAQSYSPRDAGKGFLVLGIAEIEPKRSGRFQHTPDLSAYGEKMIDVCLPRSFIPDPRCIVIAFAPVRRAGDTAINRLIWQ